MNVLRCMTPLAAALLLSAPVSAHHSDAGMDMESTITIEGTVKEYAWRNPHVYVIVETEQSGEPVDWELQNDTLVVDTANFADHRSPYQIGVPSGGQKHVIERYRLALDGTCMDAQYILEDPEYLARPMLHNRVLLPSPHLEMIYGECDEVNAGRWLTPGAD